MGVYMTVLSSQRPRQFTSSVGVGVTVIGDLVCAPVCTGERCRGPHFSVDAGTGVLLLVGSSLPHIVLLTFTFCANTMTKETYRTKDLMTAYSSRGQV